MEENSDHIKTIIEKLMEYEVELSFEIWRYVIENVDLSYDYNTSLDYIRTLSYLFHKVYNRNDLLEEILNDENLLEKLYKDNVSPDINIVADLFNSNQLEKVDNI